MFYFYKRVICIIASIGILIISVSSLYAYEVILGGHSIGILLNYDGILINGMYDIEYNDNKINQKDYGFKENDLIIEVNGNSVDSIGDLSSYISEYIDDDIILTIKRGNNKLKRKLIVVRDGNQYLTGLYVRDGIEGIGTITYYDSHTNMFGALGHIMEDGSSYIADSGYIYNNSITKINPSSKYHPGEKIGIRSSEYIGMIDKNCYSGIYGYYDKLPDKHKFIEVGGKDDIKEGDAYFYTVINGSEVNKYEIEIIDINKSNSKIKNFIFKVTDKEILNKCNGIVQGMSGSPIIQNGKLVGAVTHVLVNDPTRGYGIFIENMLDAAL